MARSPATLDKVLEQVAVVEAKVDQIAMLEAKVDQLAVALAMLTRALLEPPAASGGRQRLKLTKAQAAEDNKRRTYKARVARAAKRYGFTVEEWVERYGDVDRLPPGQRLPRRSLPQ